MFDALSVKIPDKLHSPHPSRMKMKLTFGNKTMSDSQSLGADRFGLSCLKVFAHSLKYPVSVIL